MIVLLEWTYHDHDKETGFMEKAGRKQAVLLLAVDNQITDNAPPHAKALDN